MHKDAVLFAPVRKRGLSQGHCRGLAALLRYAEAVSSEVTDLSSRAGEGSQEDGGTPWSQVLVRVGHVTQISLN